MRTRNVFDTFATHAGHVYDVSDTDYKAYNGSTHVFATFKHRFKKERNHVLQSVHQQKLKTTTTTT